MKKRRIFTLAAVLLAGLSLTVSLWMRQQAQTHPKVQVASPLLQLETVQQQKPFRPEQLTQLGDSGRTFQLALGQGKNRILARTAYGTDGWAAYYQVLSLAPDLSLGRYTGPSFAESAFQDYILLEPADPEQSPVSSLTYWNQHQLVTTAAPYHYLMAKDPAQGWIAFYGNLTPEQALALLEQDSPLA